MSDASELTREMLLEMNLRIMDDENTALRKSHADHYAALIEAERRGMMRAAEIAEAKSWPAGYATHPYEHGPRACAHFDACVSVGFSIRQAAAELETK